MTNKRSFMNIKLPPDALCQPHKKPCRFASTGLLNYELLRIISCLDFVPAYSDFAVLYDAVPYDAVSSKNFYAFYAADF